LGSLRDNHTAWLVADIQLRLMSILIRIHTKVSVRWRNATKDVIQSTSKVQTMSRHES